MNRLRSWNLRRVLWLYVLPGALGIFVASVLIGIAAKKAECDAHGGVMVRGLFETVCIKGDAVLTPNAVVSGERSESA
jgi:hypothetical protein